MNPFAGASVSTYTRTFAPMNASLAPADVNELPFDARTRKLRMLPRVGSGTMSAERDSERAARPTGPDTGHARDASLARARACSALEKRRCALPGAFCDARSGVSPTADLAPEMRVDGNRLGAGERDAETAVPDVTR